MDNYTNVTIYSTFKGDHSALYTEHFSLGARLAFLVVGLLALMITIPAIVVLRRTKKVPYAGKFLSSGLLLFDALFIFFTTLRKFFSDPMVNATLQLLGTSANLLSVISVSLMAVERYALFFYPMIYLQYVTGRLTRVITFTTWAGFLLGHWALRYGACYVKLRTLSVFSEAGLCDGLDFIYLLTCVAIATIVCSYSYANIIALIYRKTKTGPPCQPRLPIRKAVILEYKSTMFVFMCTAVMCVSFVAYGIILALSVTHGLSIEQNRTAFEFVSIVNCIMDPLWYVLWYRECRFEGLKILAHFNRNLLPKVEEMRIEIFNIVTAVKPASKAVMEEQQELTNDIEHERKLKKPEKVAGSLGDR